MNSERRRQQARKIRFGVQTGQQNTTWAELRSVWQAIESAGFDTAWLFDHFVTQYVWWIHKEDMKPLGNIP
jgi:hypothetical protein